MFSLNFRRNENTLLLYNLPIVGDGIKYKNAQHKKKGYTIVQSDTKSVFILPKIEMMESVEYKF